MHVPERWGTWFRLCQRALTVEEDDGEPLVNVGNSA